MSLLDEMKITLTEAAVELPGSRPGIRCHPATLTRWILKGVRTPDGRVVKLEALRIGHKWVTSREALRRFVEAQNPDQIETNVGPRSPAERKRAAVAAGEKLAAAGY
jgi:hypothetical protein